VNILFDIGKTFRDSVLRTFIPLGISTIDYLLLSHDHADAIMGIDDLRDFQTFDDTLVAKYKIPTFLSRVTYNCLKSKFDYIVDASEDPKPNRRVTQLKFHFLEEDPTILPQPFTISNLKITPLPVFHGGNYICLGFMFGVEQRIVYISDVSSIPPLIKNLINESKPIYYLIIDALYKSKSHYSHFGLSQVLETVREFRPRKTYLVGMYCEFDHEETNAELKELHFKENLDIELAYDGLQLTANL